MISFESWAYKWNIPPAALAELYALHTPALQSAAPGSSEAAVQNMIRLHAVKNDVLLFRNNSGVLQDHTGRPVRYGLCNDTKELNKRYKSSDLVGIKKVRIEPQHLGSVLGQAVFWEVKREGWQYNPKDEREAAQMRFLTLTSSYGADAQFKAGL